MNKSENQSIATRYAKSLIGLNNENKLDNSVIYQNLENIPFVKPLSQKNQRRLSNKEFKKHREDRER